MHPVVTKAPPGQGIAEALFFVQQILLKPCMVGYSFGKTLLMFLVVCCIFIALVKISRSGECVQDHFATGHQSSLTHPFDEWIFQLLSIMRPLSFLGA